MAFIEMDFASGGGETKEIEVKSATNSTSTQSFTAEIGKHYIVFVTRHSTSNVPSDPAISSGATIVKTIFAETAQTKRLKMLVAEIEATSTTITFAGTQNLDYYIEL